MRHRFARGDIVHFIQNKEACDIKKGRNKRKCNHYVGIIFGLPLEQHQISSNRRLENDKLVYQVFVACRKTSPVLFACPDHVDDLIRQSRDLSNHEKVHVLSMSEQQVSSGTSLYKWQAKKRDKMIQTIKMLRDCDDSDFDSAEPSLLFKTNISYEDIVTGVGLLCEQNKVSKRLLGPCIYLSETELTRPSKVLEENRFIIDQMFESIEKLRNKQLNMYYLKYAFNEWVRAVTVHTQKENSSALILQAYTRRFQHRHTVEEKIRARRERIKEEKWRSLHENFPYITHPKCERRCYNVQGTKVFLPTLALVNRWTILLKEKTENLISIVLKMRRTLLLQAIQYWRKIVVLQRKEQFMMWQEEIFGS